MKLFYALYAFSLLSSFVGTIGAMEQPGPAPVFKQKDLIIKNEYIDQIEVIYIRRDKPNTEIKFKLEHGQQSYAIDDVNSIKSLKFVAYGTYKAYLNFADPMDYRKKFNSLVWELTPRPAILYLTVTGAKATEKNKEAVLSEQPVETPQPTEWQGWGSLVWKVAKYTWEKTQAASAYAVQQTNEQIGPRIRSFVVTPAIIENQSELRIDDALHGRTFMHKPLADYFELAKSRIAACGNFLGRDLLNLGTEYSVIDANEGKRLVSLPWKNRLELYAHDPEALNTINHILKLIEEAGDNPERKFPKELLGA